MKKLLIVGAGGFARELLEIVRSLNRLQQSGDGTDAFCVLGFLDDDPHALDGKQCEYAVVGSIRDYRRTGDEVLAMGIAEPHIKEKLAAVLESAGGVFTPIIAPHVPIAPSATYGKGFVAYPGAILGPDTHTGDFVTLLSTGIGHDAQLGDFCTISSYAGINGHTTLGKRVFIGSHASLHPGIRIGDDAYVGIGSVVIRDVKAGTKVFGNPAKVMDF